MRRTIAGRAVMFLTVLVMAAFSTGALYAAPSSSKAITSFSIAGTAGTIEETAITVDLTSLSLFGRVDGLVATFKTNGKAVRVGSKDQVSGKTPNDFTKPLTYKVMAADGSSATYTVRVLVSKITSVSGYADTMAVGSDGSLWATGYNKLGQLGNGTTTSVSAPVQILADGVASVSAGVNFSLIVKTDGSLWVTGYNSSGQLGTGTAANVSTPVQIIDSGVASVSGGEDHSLIVKKDGSLWAMGYNKFGQIGNGTTIDALSPVQVLAGGVAAVAAGGDHSLILKSDGSLWTTGYNKNGELGNGNGSGVLAPVQIRRPSLSRDD